MGTPPAKLDGGSAIASALFRTAPDNDSFKIQANFEFSCFLVSVFEKGGIFKHYFMLLRFHFVASNNVILPQAQRMIFRAVVP